MKVCSFLAALVAIIFYSEADGKNLDNPKEEGLESKSIESHEKIDQLLLQQQEPNGQNIFGKNICNGTARL